MKIIAISQAGQTNPAAAKTATVPDAPDFKQCIADKKKTAAKPAKGQPEPTDAQLQDAVPAAVRPVPRPGPGLPDPLHLARPGGQPAQGQGRRQDDRQADRRHQEAAVRPEGQLREVPAERRADQRGRALPAAHPRAAEPDHVEGDQGQGQGHRRPDRRLLQQEQVALLAARAARPAHRADQGQGQGRAGQEGARVRAVAGRPWPRSTRSTRPPRPRAASSPGVAKGQQEPAFDKAIFAAKKGKLDGPGQDAVRLLRLRRHEDHPEPSSRRSTSPRPRSSRSWPRRTSRTR